MGGEVSKKQEKPQESITRRGKEYRTSPLCAMRREAGFKATRLAEAAVGFSRQRISQWEQGTFFPSDEHLLAMARAYAKPPEEVMRASVLSWQQGISHRRYVHVLNSLVGAPQEA